MFYSKRRGREGGREGGRERGREGVHILYMSCINFICYLGSELIRLRDFLMIILTHC